MQYRKVPKTGDEISAIGYGCMRFPTRMGRIDEKKAEEQIRYAIDQGVNYFDTAYPYHAGNSERFLGKVFADKSLREKVKIATKLPPWVVKSRQDMDRILKDQLEKLGVDYIDYYLIHGIMRQDSWDELKEMGVIEFLDEAKAKGYVKNVGFSFHSNLETFKNVVNDYDWAMCQIQYNYLDEYVQAGTEGLKYVAERDIAVFIMEPLRGGNLAGEMPKQVQKEWDSASVKRSATEWALRWIWDHPEVTCVLSGMNDDAHIRENIQTAETALPGHLQQDEIERIERVRDIFGSLTKVPCTGCAYCMPCPAGVNIPLCFERYNGKYLFGPLEARVLYHIQTAVMDSHSSKASQCVGCGKCEKHCPQHIQIRDELKKVTAEMEGRISRPLTWMIKKAFKSQISKD